ncbi:APC family permease [Neobacillus sp. WH10]|uniref:APC family permease n=1 Tax=Neobacillus sp. WH10 TaxID=3047873 RepID=UPI0024C14B5D|nr:APC family permease [Neobacillus sp. WH10]WHY79400.1 APC family permease [Neobacillus sp. WH10]
MEVSNIKVQVGIQELNRSLKMLDLVIFGLVFMAPVAAMSLFGIITLVSKGNSVLSYVIGFVAMLFTAYSFGQMVKAFPVAGSTYSYAQRSLHPKLGFIAGWGMLLDYLFIPILTFLISASFANALVPSIPIWAWILIFSIPVTIINLIGIELAAKVNFVLAFLMIMAVLIFVGSTTHYLVTGNLGLFHLGAVYNPNSFSIGAIVGGAAIVTVAYLGFDAITTLAEEAKVDGKKIGLAIILACVIQTSFYVAVTYLGMVLMKDYTKIDNPDTAFFNLLPLVAGGLIQTFITLMIIASGVASALASQSASSRLLYGMGRDNVIPNKFFGYIHPKYKTPVYNILLMSVLGTVGAMAASLQVISDLVAFGALLGFACVNLSVINHYYIRNKQRNIIKYLVVPLIGVAVCIYILIGLSTIAKIFGLAWMTIGILYLIVISFQSKSVNILPTGTDKNIR